MLLRIGGVGRRIQSVSQRVSVDKRHTPLLHVPVHFVPSNTDCYNQFCLKMSPFVLALAVPLEPRLEIIPPRRDASDSLYGVYCHILFAL